MSESLRWHAGLDVLEVDALSGVDGQGLPAYGSAVSGYGVVQYEVQVVRNTRGEEVQVVATAYVDPEDVAAVARENDRVTVDGRAYIVVVVRPVRGIQSEDVDHIELHLRNE